MIRTDHPEYLNELQLVSDLFYGTDAPMIVHSLKREGNALFSCISVENQTFNESGTLPACDALTEKRLVKRFYKLALYHALKTVTGRRPAWGALTGVRPVKLAYMVRESGGDPLDFLANTMDVTEEKAGMIGRILRAQEGIYERKDDNYNLYISLPFCPTKCVYCSFISAEIGKCTQFIEPYIAALEKEISAVKRFFPKLRSVYIGGGTPVALPNDALCRVLDAVGNVKAEYTVEAGRPDCITRENLQILKDHGVTRVCVNPQSFSDRTLAAIGRKHTGQDAVDKYYLVKEYGFDVNMDFIAGLPEETLSGFLENMDKVCELSPENVTVHTLCLKSGSTLKEQTDRLSEGDVSRMVSGAYERLSAAGYEPYYLYRQKYMAANQENTGYAQKGKVCVYNVDNMEDTSPVIACGANAVSKRVFNAENRVERYGSPKDFVTYLNKADQIIREKDEFFR